MTMEEANLAIDEVEAIELITKTAKENPVKALLGETPSSSDAIIAIIKAKLENDTEQRHANVKYYDEDKKRNGVVGFQIGMQHAFIVISNEIKLLEKLASKTPSSSDVKLAENNYAILILDSMKLKFFRNRDDFDMANQTLLESNKRLIYLKKSKNSECWIKPDDYNM